MPDTTAPTGRPEQTGQPAAHAGPNASEMRLYSATGERLYLPSEAAFLAGQFNAKRIGLALYVLLLRPIKT